MNAQKVPLLTASDVAEIAEKCGTRDDDFYVMSPFQLFAFAQRCVNRATEAAVVIPRSTPEAKDARIAQMRSALELCLEALTDGETVEPHSYLPAIAAARAAITGKTK